MSDGTPEPDHEAVAPGAAGEANADALDPICDEAFDRALSAFERGQEFELEAFLDGRESLRVAVEESVQLAREVVVHAPRSGSPPREVAGYELERELGAGSMGTVFLARQRSLGGRRVALKVLPPSLGLSARSKARFLAEARALAKLDHPGIVGVHDVIDADGVVAFAMDWVPGGSLAGVLAAWREEPERDELEVLARCLGVERGRLAAPNATTWILQAFARLARALGAVHQKGLLHRDIKPGNILVRGDGELLLSDFGLVRDTEASLHTRTGAYVGTLAYSSPEQLRGEQETIDARSDLYSFGVTLYEALSLKLPYSGRTLAEVQRRAESGHLEPLCRKGARLPRDLETVLAKTLDPEPARRYASADQLAEDLERLLSFRPILARPAGVATRAARFLRRHRATVVATSALALAVIALAAQGSRWWLARQRADDDASVAWKAAELALLEPRTADRASANPESLEAVLPRFDDALAFRPSESLRQGIALERAVIERAIDLAQGRDEPRSYGLDACPLTLEFSRRWRSGARPTVHQLEDAQPSDRRMYGLMAYLLGEPEQAFEAWRHAAGSFPIDPLADALAGEYLREQGRYERAFSLLRTALDHFNEANFLYVRLADAAVGSGQLEIAEDLLKQAEEHPDHGDPYDTRRRVEGDLCVLRGEDRKATEHYAWMLASHQGRIARYHFSQFLELRGRPLEALWLLDGYLDHEFVRLAEEWWSSSPQPSWQLLRQCLADPDLPLGPFPAFVQRYRAAHERVQQGTTGADLTLSPFTSSLARQREVHAPRQPSLIELAGCDELTRLDLPSWRQLPVPLQELHAIVLCSRWAGVVAPCLRVLERAVAAVQRSFPSEASTRTGSRDWPSSLGGADNRRRARGASLAQNSSMVWSHAARGSPVVRDGLVVFQEADEPPDDLVGMYGNASVVAVDLATGVERWRVATTSLKDCALPTPCIVGARVFLSCSRQGSSRQVAPARTQRVECRSLASGELLWTWDSATDGGIWALQGFEDSSGRARLLVTRTDFRIERLRKTLPSEGRLTVLDAGAPNALAAELGLERGSWLTQSHTALPPVAIRKGIDSMEVWLLEPPGALAPEATSGSMRVTRWNIETGASVTLDLGGHASARDADVPACVLDSLRSRLYVLSRSGWLEGLDIEAGRSTWPGLQVSRSDASVCTVLDDGRVVVVDPTVPRLTLVGLAGDTQALELSAPPVPRGFFEADGDELWIATSDGRVSRLTRGEDLERVAEISGVCELVAAGHMWLARTGERLMAYRSVRVRRPSRAGEGGNR